MLVLLILDIYFFTTFENLLNVLFNSDISFMLLKFEVLML